uniref:Nuclear transport factor 2 n=1 Tax=Endocarpon pusillum TaxID=364733 RepID=F8QX37_9EURO|nr:nuclear transport factor 2 [Endocarpon pusillum]
MAGFDEIAKQFVDFYYKAFDADRTSLSALYRQESMLTFESVAVATVGSIIEKLTSLPFQKVQHRVDTTDAQPSGQHGGILVMVTGALMVDDEPKPMNFTQTFQLMPDSGSFFVLNDIFKLVYPAL